jgi:hypothetical protein
MIWIVGTINEKTGEARNWSPEEAVEAARAIGGTEAPPLGSHCRAPQYLALPRGASRRHATPQQGNA